MLSGMFPSFPKRTANVLSVVVRGFFVWFVPLLAGYRPLSPQFRKVYRPPVSPVSDLFFNISVGQGV